METKPFSIFGFIARTLLLSVGLTALYLLYCIVMAVVAGYHTVGNLALAIPLAMVGIAVGLLYMLSGQCGSYGGCFPATVIIGMSVAGAWLWTFWRMRRKA